MLAFRHQDSAQTLAEGIAEYYAAHPQLKRGAALSPDAQAFFRCHDTVHVVFGCDTSLDQEAVVKLSSFFGTTAGFSTMKGYRLYESQDIYRTLRWTDVARVIAVSFVIVPRTLYRCARLSRRWPWDGYDDQLQRPLADIRREFRIRVA